MKKVPIFKAGKHVDSAGDIREWTEADVRSIADKYDPINHSAPIVIGHPKDNAPAYGWVDKVEFLDGILYADFKEMNDGFVEAVKSGAYKKRSISLYPDLSLRHIGFLGAVPPAVKGLADIAFSEGVYMTVEFEEKTTAINVFDFADAIATQDAKIKALRDEIRKKEDEEIRFKIENFVDEQIKAGRLAPAQKEMVVNIGLVCKKAHNYDFSEIEKKASDEFEKFISALPVRVEFGEFATEGKAKTRCEKALDLSDRISLHESVKQYAKDNSISYAEALSKITNKE